MSTRCSIIYDYGIHLYLEILTGEVCLSVPSGAWNDESAKTYGTWLDEYKEDLVVPYAKLKEWRDALTRFIDDNPEPIEKGV